MPVTNRPCLDVYQIEPWVLAWEPVEAVAPAAASTAPPALHIRRQDHRVDVIGFELPLPPMWIAPSRGITGNMRSSTCPKAGGQTRYSASFAVTPSTPCSNRAMLSRRDSIAAARIGYYATEAEANAARARYVDEAGDRPAD